MIYLIKKLPKKPYDSGMSKMGTIDMTNKIFNLIFSRISLLDSWNCREFL